MRFDTTLAALTLATLALGTNGCAASSEDENAEGSTADALSMATREYDDALSEITKVQTRCETEGRCETSDVGTQSIRPLAAPKQNLRGIRLCDAVKPLERLESPYFFVGAGAKAAAITTIADGGADVVFDLRNQQAGFFHYHTHGYQNLIGLDANIYSGYAFGKKENVLAAWSGTFEGGAASVEVPVLNLGVGALIFRSPDNSLFGAAAQASIGVNALGHLGIVQVSVSDGDWTAWDAATQMLGKSLFLVRYEEKTAKADGKPHVYLQFQSAKDIALALVERFGGLGAIPAAQAVGLAALKKANLTIAEACPDR